MLSASPDGDADLRRDAVLERTFERPSRAHNVNGLQRGGSSLQMHCVFKVASWAGSKHLSLYLCGSKPRLVQLIQLLDTVQDRLLGGLLHLAGEEELVEDHVHLRAPKARRMVCRSMYATGTRSERGTGEKACNIDTRARGGVPC